MQLVSLGASEILFARGEATGSLGTLPPLVEPSETALIKILCKIGNTTRAAPGEIEDAKGLFKKK
jgi:hypothetical protein